MAALEAVRAELETALGGDENWRALRPTGRDQQATRTPSGAIAMRGW